jgi:hypothetical protein
MVEELKPMMQKCNCEFCTAYRKYIWAVVMSCGCSCHRGDGMTGHGGLCCEIPNGLKKNNPYPELEDKELCEKIKKEFLDKWWDWINE